LRGFGEASFELEKEELNNTIISDKSDKFPILVLSAVKKMVGAPLGQKGLTLFGELSSD
jgi:hypothetical protein